MRFSQRTEAFFLLSSMCLFLASCTGFGTLSAIEGPYTPPSQPDKYDGPRIEIVKKQDPSKPNLQKPSGPIEVTIGDAIFMALGNNRELNVENLNPTIQRTFEDQERAVFDPVLE
ncbi:TolC family protein, partial [Thermodesulfobacteriota bacterium]